MPLSIQIDQAEIAAEGNLSFQVEDFKTFLRDGAHIFPRHFKELSLNQDQFPFCLDEEMYFKAENNQLLHIVTARLDGEMIGYVVSVVYKHHPHNAGAGPYSATDMFYVLPEHRHGAGARLLKANEIALRKLGVRRMSISTKLKDAHLELFTMLGYEATDLLFHKVFACL